MSEGFDEGVRMFVQGMYEQALYFLEDVDPVDEPEAAYYQALSYSKLGRSDEALAALVLLISHETNFLKLLQAKMIRSYLLTTDRRYPEAEAALRGMLEEGVESVQVFSNYGYVLWALGRGKEGIAWLNRALALDPDNANALNSMGYILAEEGVLLDKALAYCRKALTLKKDNPAYLDSLGWVYYRMGQHKMGALYLQKAVDAQPDNVDFRVHLVEVERALGGKAK
ncbi:MAG: tetratricopeptide repeat protein [Spirochaetales bacterium]